jgi:coproporphyrinogen III oxidase-like Fe-S oxidoreductase
MESYFERVVDRVTAHGYRWYETVNFCRAPELADGRDLRARHNLAYWLGRDYLGIGVGAVSTIDGRRWQNTPRLGAYLAALCHGRRPPREVEALPRALRRRERVMLGLRLDEPLPVSGLEDALDADAVGHLRQLGLVQTAGKTGLTERLLLTRRGRFLGGAVTAELLA